MLTIAGRSLRPVNLEGVPGRYYREAARQAILGEPFLGIGERGTLGYSATGGGSHTTELHRPVVQEEVGQVRVKVTGVTGSAGVSVAVKGRLFPTDPSVVSHAAITVSAPVVQTESVVDPESWAVTGPNVLLDGGRSAASEITSTITG